MVGHLLLLLVLVLEVIVTVASLRYFCFDDGIGYEDVMMAVAIALPMAMAMSLVMAMGMALVAQLLSHHSSVGSSGQ